MTPSQLASALQCPKCVLLAAFLQLSDADAAQQPSYLCPALPALASQAHFSGVVAPALSGSVSELSAASSALLALIRAAEDSITVVLRKSVDACISQVGVRVRE